MSGIEPRSSGKAARALETSLQPQHMILKRFLKTPRYSEHITYIKPILGSKVFRVFSSSLDRVFWPPNVPPNLPTSHEQRNSPWPPSASDIARSIHQLTNLEEPQPFPSTALGRRGAAGFILFIHVSRSSVTSAAPGMHAASRCELSAPRRLQAELFLPERYFNACD